MLRRLTLVAVGFVTVVAFVQDADAQGGRTPATACELLSLADIRRITGLSGYTDTDATSGSDVAGGGSACRYETGFSAPPPHPPAVTVVLIQGNKNYTRRGLVKLPPGCRFDTVTGLGNDAYFRTCTSPRQYRSPLYVKKGANELIVQINNRPTTPDASSRATTIAVARAAAAKLP